MSCSSVVRFNVGGTKYEVARSTIDKYPDTMLARLVSETWQVDPSKEIFIERDGSRFRFVLDYMRDMTISLPVTDTTPPGVLRELEYFGFEGVSLDVIDCSCTAFAAAQHVFDAIETGSKVAANLESKAFHTKLATELVQHYIATGSSSKKYTLSNQINGRPFCNSRLKERELADCLAAFGCTVTTKVFINGEKITCFTISKLG